jgi:hypothetical protein
VLFAQAADEARRDHAGRDPNGSRPVGTPKGNPGTGVCGRPHAIGCRALDRARPLSSFSCGART